MRTIQGTRQQTVKWDHLETVQWFLRTKFMQTFRMTYSSSLFRSFVAVTVHAYSYLRAHSSTFHESPMNLIKIRVMGEGERIIKCILYCVRFGI